jgi:tetratricopeptide (TPR) repeat protein
VWQKRQKFVSERDALYQQLRATPGARPLHAKLAHLFGTHGDVEGSLRNHATALRRAPDAPQTLVAAARDLTAGGFPERALLLAERAVAQGPRSPDAREALGDALLNLGRMDEAIANYNYTTNYVPSRAPAIQARVNRYAAAHPQPLSPAEKAYREALGLVEGQIGLSRTPARALELAEKANELDPGNITYLRLLLRLQFGARKMPEAIKTAEQVAQIAPDDAVTQALLAVMLVEFAKESADFARVESYLDAAKNAPEAAAQWHYGTGLLALRRGDGARAAAALTEAARLDPAADITFYKLAQAEQMRGRKEAAAKAMAEYQRRQKLKEEEFGLQGDISQHPDRPAVYEKLAAFYEKHQRLAEARAIREAARRRFSSGTAGAKAASAVNHKPSEKRERGQSK